MWFRCPWFPDAMNMTAGTFAENARTTPETFGLAPARGTGWEEAGDNGFAAAAALIAAVAFSVGALVGLLVA
jgi:hypothetical protein